MYSKSQVFETVSIPILLKLFINAYYNDLRIYTLEDFKS